MPGDICVYLFLLILRSQIYENLCSTFSDHALICWHYYNSFIIKRRSCICVVKMFWLTLHINRNYSWYRKNTSIWAKGLYIIGVNILTYLIIAGANWQKIWHTDKRTSFYTTVQVSSTTNSSATTKQQTENAAKLWSRPTEPLIKLHTIHIVNIIVHNKFYITLILIRQSWLL